MTTHRLRNVSCEILVVLSILILFFIIPKYKACAYNAYDISNYQGPVSARQAKNLKSEVNFMVLRGQYGQYRDPSISHNIYMMSKYRIPYGVYASSYYRTPYQARHDAYLLYKRAPHADFYVNSVGQPYKGINSMTRLWSHEIHEYTSRPVILFTNLYFMDNHLTGKTRSSYNAVWLSAYDHNQPDPHYHYDLWQFTDKRYSRALNEYVDGDTSPYGAKPLSFWTGRKVRVRILKRNKNKRTRRPRRRIVRQRIRRKRPYTKKKVRKRVVGRKKSVKRVATYARKPIRKRPQRKGRRIKRIRINRSRSNFRNVKRTKATPSDLNAILKKMPVSFGNNYYRDSDVTYLKVINNRGIDLYNPRGIEIMHVPKNTVLEVNSFINMPINGNQTISCAEGVYKDISVVFTSNKQFVQQTFI